MSQHAFVNIAAHLVKMAARQPDREALGCPVGKHRPGRCRYAFYTFAELNRESDQVAAGLRAIGISRGVRTVLMVPPSPEFFTLTFALFKVGAVLVLVDPGMGLRYLKQCLQEAQPEAFIGVPKAHAARSLFGWCRSTLRTRVTVGGRLAWGGHSLNGLTSGDRLSSGLTMAETREDEIAAILFTSGSTGPPKGAVYTHGIFDAQVSLLKKTYGIQGDEIDLCTFPLFALFAPALGMTAVIPQMDPTRPAAVDPERIIEPVRTFGVTNLFGSPALLDRVGRFGNERGIKLPTLRRVISAGAPVHADVLERFAAMLSPGTEIHTPYGATEALPVCTIGSHEILGETRHRTATGGGVCVGRRVEGMSVHVIRISEEPIELWDDGLVVPPGEVGEIVVRGPVVTQAYFNRPQSTGLAKISSREGADAYHRMGDVGYLDDHGRLWFCGRKSHRVVTPDETLFTVPCEAIFNAHPDVRRTALVGVNVNGAVRPVLCVEREPSAPHRGRKRLVEELLSLGRLHACTSSIETILFRGSFPVDVRHNSKIFREKLAVWAARQLGTVKQPAATRATVGN